MWLILWNKETANKAIKNIQLSHLQWWSSPSHSRLHQVILFFNIFLILIKKKKNPSSNMVDAWITVFFSVLNSLRPLENAFLALPCFHFPCYSIPRIASKWQSSRKRRKNHFAPLFNSNVCSFATCSLRNTIHRSKWLIQFFLFLLPIKQIGIGVLFGDLVSLIFSEYIKILKRMFNELDHYGHFQAIWSLRKDLMLPSVC